jgi:hypothetical protein
MIIFYIDTEQTKINYADCLANSHDGMSYGSTIEFLDDDYDKAREDHSNAMQEIMDCQVLGFSNNLRTANDPPCMTLNDLNLHENGYYAYCKLMAEKDCLVIRVGQGDGNEPKAIMEMHTAVLRFLDHARSENFVEEINKDLKNID